MKTLLIEIFTEELPPKALKTLGEHFAEPIFKHLKANDFLENSATFQGFATPRRLAVLIHGVLKVSAPKTIRQKLMPVKIGLDENGNKTAALLKKLKALSVDNPESAALETENNTLFITQTQIGTALADFLNVDLPKVLNALPIPKMMSYQAADGWTTTHFVRPAHRLVVMLDDEILPITLLGLSAGNKTQGHRFAAKTPEIVFKNAKEYEERLQTDGAVIANFEKRRALIAEALIQVADECSQKIGKVLKPLDDPELLDETTALVENPAIFLGTFDESFLKVPQECLILTMKANQKYFPLLQENGALFHQFLMVANLSPENPAAIIHGNERVLRARLSDAAFFFEEDKKTPLAARLPMLEKIRYHHALGSQSERCKRVLNIAEFAAAAILPEQKENLCQAARLFKADLASEMVGEFPELQGIMGRYYALNDGLDKNIAFAIEDHYRPRFAGDDLPRNAIGKILALADKLESLVGLFGINQMPTGEKDPFGLRRAAIGVVRLLTEGGLKLSLESLLENATQNFLGIANFKNPRSTLKNFLLERYLQILQKDGWELCEIEAVLAVESENLCEVLPRLAALRAFLKLPESQDLIQIHKRVYNILKKSNSEKTHFSIALLENAAEKNLFNAQEQLQPKMQMAFEEKNYAQCLHLLLALKNPLNVFFEEVLVNAEEENVRQNRHALLFAIAKMLKHVADLSKL